MKTNYALHFNKFREGNEQGLEFFYKLWYHRYYYWGLKYIKDEVNAGCIVNEAFLRLWLLRQQMASTEEIEQLLKKLTAAGCRAFYSTGNHQFQRNMLRLDEIENYQDWMAGFDPRLESEEEMLYEREPEEALKAQWARVESVIPNLNPDQQLFVRLCIKYSFDYGRIAWHVGGISDYQVAKKVEKTLACLRAIITDTQKLEAVGQAGTFKFEGDVCEEQSAILHMRYELQYSFEEIARELNLNQGYIQKAFVNAMTKIRKVKS
ncbi:MAG: sigma factor-like helix-turn-helix DNA-binding protein [Pedobacter sp.]|uniref:sigma factor-like helix-turn-helix DNA-binding protein n=1 Tax=Pedobacter sp. TaxID=1411316 RepID=UPI00280678CB|nr:sigma factor-like helix-turn-helix DNA-binding protein [Pedobacter sp.]MDQ8004950.1 sigma factor-like helix-turn-helix DNA-binding protein [Pedobacter sp.]